jgi:NADH-quinone oxidoreductase subunit A
VASTRLVTAGRRAKFATLLFVVFDVEAVFIFPWATQLERYGMFGLVEMGAFVFILLLGLIYAWRKGVLRWV